MKVCNKCKVEKPEEDFPWHKKDKRHYSCKPCYNASIRANRRAKPELQKARARRAIIRSYGIEPEEYDSLLKAQGGGCAVCRSSERLVIDHDHDTGAVRGLLCNTCNLAMGYIDKGPDYVVALLRYAEHPSNNRA